MPRRLVQGYALDIVMAQSVPKIRHLRQRHHQVPVGAVGHVVDEVDDAVFQPARVEAVDDMDDERGRAFARFHAPAVKAARGGSPPR